MMSLEAYGLTAKLEILYFTDPFCSWCWASEPQLYRLRERYRGQLTVRNVMGGLVEDMSHFYDAVNQIGSTAQVAPHWREVCQRTGQPIDERVMEDIVDPHWSTWPACIAVKAAQLQGDAIGDKYLRRLRRAIMTERVNVSERDAQLRLAQDVEGLNVEQLQEALDNGAAMQAFVADRQLMREYGATGFPTLLFLNHNGPDGPTGMLVNGYRSSETYDQVVQRVAPELQPQPPRPIPEMLAEYGPMTTRELAEVVGKAPNELMAALSQSMQELGLRRIEVPHGELWTLA